MAPVTTSGLDRHFAAAPDVNLDIIKRARIYALVPVSLFLVLSLLLAAFLVLLQKRRTGREEQAKKSLKAYQDRSATLVQSPSDEFQLAIAKADADYEAFLVAYPQYRESTKEPLTLVLPAKLRQTSQFSALTSPDPTAVSSHICPGSFASLVSATMPGLPLLPLSIESTYPNRSPRSSAEFLHCSWAPGSPSLPQEILESPAQVFTQDLLASPLQEIVDAPEASPEIPTIKEAAPAPVDPTLTSPWEIDPARYFPFVTSSVPPVSRESTPSLDSDISDSSDSEEAVPVESNIPRELSPAYGQLDFTFTFPPRPISASLKPHPVSSGSSVRWQSDMSSDSETEYVIASVPCRFHPGFEAY